MALIQVTWPSQQLPAITLPASNVWRIEPTRVKSATELFLRLPNNNFEKMIDDMKTFYSTSYGSLVDKPAVGKIYALESAMRGWVRVKVLEETEGIKFDLQFCCTR